MGTCPVDVRWERVPSELGGNVSRASRVRKCIVQVGWERSPSELGGNVSQFLGGRNMKGFWIGFGQVLERFWRCFWRYF